jgi:Bax protein|tara:strand:+ start:38 stop:679 length:642 start_codon:yes stop_codon:yes gene_type:complete
MRKIYKKTLIVISILIFVILSTYVAGTFNPNRFVIKQIEDEVHKKEMKIVEELGLMEPEFEFNDKVSFINATSRCVSYLNWTTDKDKRVPISIIIAMAGIESAWGQSRFAQEGNALFGVRTWDLENTPHMKALGNPDADWGVKKYQTKCDSVKDMIRILNTHPAYEKFREYREIQLKTGEWNYSQLLSGMTAWSTNQDYQKIILNTIVDNKLP